MAKSVNIEIEQLTDIVEKAAQKGATEGANAALRADAHEIVIEALAMLGLDTSEPIELQKDFHHLRDSRKLKEAIGSEKIKLGVKAFATAVAVIIILGVKSWIEGTITGTP